MKEKLKTEIAPAPIREAIPTSAKEEMEFIERVTVLGIDKVIILTTETRFVLKVSFGKLFLEILKKVLVISQVMLYKS